MLTQLATLKARLGLAESDVQDDELLTRFIVAISARFERECNRVFDRAEDATFEFRADRKLIPVARYPVESVSKWELKANETDGWVEQTDIVYLLGPGRAVIELGVALGTREEIARVTFDGGYVLPGATPATGQTALPAEIEHACVEQCAYLYANKNRLGIGSASGQGASLTLNPLVNALLNEVSGVLKKYERWEP